MFLEDEKGGYGSCGYIGDGEKKGGGCDGNCDCSCG